jgi:hypothetical protein
MSDAKIVTAAIYPAIGIARVGNSQHEYYIGPEVPWPQHHPPGFYKDSTGALKREAARFRIYGLNAQGDVVKELTADDATITWQVEVANKKAAWYEFIQALDLQSSPQAPRRNAAFRGEQRKQLEIVPEPIAISGRDVSGPQHAFEGAFVGKSVYLGELQTDAAGRLLFLGGHGVSASAFPNNSPTTFGNNDGWHDDTSDGPVTATVVYNNEELEVEPAWVVTAPPNYAPDIISVLTMWDVMDDAFQGQFYKATDKPSFQYDILPLLQQFTAAQWVNYGFYVGFGYHQPFDFENDDLVAELSNADDAFREHRRQVFHNFRNPNGKEIDVDAWPWMYGDEVTIPAQSHGAFLSITPTLYGYLQQWVSGDYIADWDPHFQPPRSLEDIKDPAEEAAALTKAALWFCLGGPFHPGCEMTWPMRHASLYRKAFRIRMRALNEPEIDYGDQLTYEKVMAESGPLYAQGPGDITRWMAVPWQTDTSSCRAGYDSKYDPWIPTFWPARVPNSVLAEKEYKKVIDDALPRQQRLEAFNTRAIWYRILGDGYLTQINNMISRWGDLGVIQARPGVPVDPDFPDVIFVESVPFAPGCPGDGAEQASERAVEAEAVPYDQGKWTGPVAKVLPKG